MALVAPQWLAVLVAELHDTPDGLLAAHKEAFAALASGYPAPLDYLLVRQRALTLLIGDLMRVLQQAQTPTDIDAARAMLQVRQEQARAVATDLTSYQTQTGATGAGGIAVGLLTTTAPIAAPPGWPDANDRAYRGDPYRRSGGWR